MDPLTQGLIGVALPQAFTRDRRWLVWAGCFGFLAGMAPDLDVLIRSSSDPILFLEFHRHFTHSVLFIPVGGLVCAAIFHLVLGRRTGVPFRLTWLFCTLGYGTHGLLDAFTSYGTLLWWPFSSERVAFSFVSVIDPLFTIPVLVLVTLATGRRQRSFAIGALLWAGLYLGAAMLQRSAAIEMGETLAASRDHTPLRLDAKPSFGNILIWKIIYETQDRFFVDAARPTFAPRVFPGASVRKLDVGRDFPGLDINSQQGRDIQRFSVFSDDFLAQDPLRPDRIIDLRYSMVPNEIDALWSIGISSTAEPDTHVTFQSHHRNTKESFERLWSMMTAPTVE
ncbi:MAG: metal-dependent hydrolase [Alphaproteobacteria bacterium]|nr:metal-dependent hydrolase [Rhodospirillaceae bacterium]MBT6511438.1 metal-dependent hydrolase [Rhodospirillaceae bacterium]MBT7615040.1 metal-dependent hydrolase [Rhodospirillaceae bacterium]MBT7647754.1 metal-dependent hydrolase [Rhodospirillaceae bacterium]MDG2480663.1 metal-dependent hydrolase [Alphaproteobacteria bacterium]